jgi:hypothetical protein
VACGLSSRVVTLIGGREVHRANRHDLTPLERLLDEVLDLDGGVSELARLPLSWRNDRQDLWKNPPRI